MMSQNILADRHNPLIFLHIPKTGGTTLNRILERQYSTTAYYEDQVTDGDMNCREGVLALTELQKQEFRVFSGHFSFGIQDILPHPSWMITLLRDPVERLLSQYAHVARQPDHFLHQHLAGENERQVSLSAFLRADFVEADNAQVRALAGPDATGLPFGGCNEDVLEQAKKNIAEGVAVAGLTERFDETLVLLMQQFNWISPCYLRQRVGENRLHQSDVLPEDWPYITQMTQWDRKLYDFAAAGFEQRIAAEGAAFVDAVRRFHAANARYQRMKSLAQSGVLQAIKKRLPINQILRLDAALRTALSR